MSEVERNLLTTAICGITKSWVSQVAQMQQLDTVFARKLAACTKPSEAAALCGSWMGHRMDSAFAMQHRIFEAWLQATTRVEFQSNAQVSGIAQPGCERHEQANRPKAR